MVLGTCQSIALRRELEDQSKATDVLAEFFQATNPVLTHIVGMCSIPDSENGFSANPRVGAAPRRIWTR